MLAFFGQHFRALEASAINRKGVSCFTPQRPQYKGGPRPDAMEMFRFGGFRRVADRGSEKGPLVAQRQRRMKRVYILRCNPLRSWAGSGI